MVIPLELFVLLLLISAGLLWGVLRFDVGCTERVGFVLVSIACLTIGISGRFPPPSGARAYSPFVAMGGWIMLAGVALAVLGEVRTFVRRRQVRHRIDRE